MASVLFLYQTAFAQTAKIAADAPHISVAFWNTENFFDTLNESNRDEEYLPNGKYQWNTEKYENKVNHVYRVVSNMHSDILGLCEIENGIVLRDFLKNDTFGKLKYSVVHFESGDERGIDVALLYNVKKLRLLKAETIKVPLENGDKTRDILYCELRTITSDTLHVFVNHWPSRLGGIEKSEGKRIAAANALKSFIATHQLENKKILVMGDFNDEPENTSISRIAGSCDAASGATSCLFYNLASTINRDTLGSIYYRGHWQMFDQIWLGSALYYSEGKMKYQSNSFKVYAPNWMRTQTSDRQPLRTFSGGVYLNGYSDHFPVTAVLRHD